MQLSIREAKARFSEVVTAAEKGEHIVITRHGRPVVDLVPTTARKGGVDWDAGERFRKKMGWEDGAFEWPEEFDDPAFSRKVLGLDE